MAQKRQLALQLTTVLSWATKLGNLLIALDDIMTWVYIQAILLSPTNSRAPITRTLPTFFSGFGEAITVYTGRASSVDGNCGVSVFDKKNVRVNNKRVKSIPIACPENSPV